MKKITLEVFRERAKEKHNNFYDYSKVNFNNVFEKIEIICPVHGNFFQEVSTHLRGHSCVKCYRDRRKTVTKDVFLKRAREKHGNSYDYSKVNFSSVADIIEIVCPKHGSFFQEVSRHFISGCKKCSDERCLFKRKYKINDNFFDTIGIEQAYVLGLIYSDGNISKKGNSFSIGQSHDRGKVLLQSVRKMLGANYPIYYKKEEANASVYTPRPKNKGLAPSGDSYTLVCSSKKILEYLRSIGLTNNKTKILPYPTFLSSNMHKYFLRGFIDGDGCCGIYNSGTTNYLLISFVGPEKFIRECSKVIPIDRIKINTKMKVSFLHELKIQGEKAIEFGRWLWGDNSLPKYFKQDAWEIFIKSYNPRYLKYKEVKEDVKKMLKAGMSPYKISKKINVPFQTVYKWRSSYARDTKVSCRP